MGQFLSRMGILLGTRINNYDSNRIPLHHKCRNCGRGCDPMKSTTTCANAKFTRTGTKDQVAIIRPVIPDEKVRWSSSFDYQPVEFTAEKVRTSTKEYVDRDPRQDPSVEIPWNSDDRLCDRRSYHGTYKIIGRVPQNPCGRTGITGRGHLGHFGPNHAADPIVTRWKRDADGEKVIHTETGKPILQFVCIKRKDTNEYAIPGGMVDKKEKVTDTLQREFQEETLNFPELDERKKHDLLATIKDIFENGGIRIYCGYVDDPRNTDNSWMETTAYNFHDGNNEHLALINVHGGSDALSAFWHDLGSETPLFASHADFVERVAHLHQAHW
ncbi:unnamed protein product [Rotaria magnacalcarata]|nr:unnamed protein product [Rotaria magnacalcarata]CAF1657710.1 unnamed protein product [Rotaria magnacalcarata]CAF2154100.1 unnamed protein product [Rotaria magnacalcarata]CAF2211426.1 unnamed protein product [Rotaria magnacalcarata]CAF3983357.1 unnamed protein product [Rotaria magnacalcarata]